MKIGLIDEDGHNFPNLALMKISAHHKAQGDEVEWHWGWGEYDRVYMSKVFDSSYSEGVFEPVNTNEIIKGGTGYDLKNALPYEIEHMCPDYSLYPTLTKDTAYGFLSRGCPRGCPFCVVKEKEGLRSHKVADVTEWWSGQKNIMLCDPNILACKDHLELLGQLADTGASVDFNQGLDARLLTDDNIKALNGVKVDNIHFAWDLMEQSEAVVKGLNLYKEKGRKVRGSWGMVYVLTNFNTTKEENLYRIYKLHEMGFDPYVMIYDKPNAPKETRHMQRWCNNKFIFKSCEKFEDYKP